MTDDLFPIKTVYPPANMEKGFWVVLAYWGPGGWWKLYGGLYSSEEEAIHVAETLPRGYTERRVYHLK